MAFLRTINIVVHHPLNRGRVFKAILRYLKWQITSRLMPGEVIYEWIKGVRFVVRPRETGLVESIYTGLLEFEEMAFFLHYVGSTDLFVDVGANVGIYTLLSCGVKGARGYAFEPIPATYLRLSQNIRLNGLEDWVKFINAGVGDKPGTLYFTDRENVTNHVLRGAGKKDSLKVNVVTLDNILKDEKPSALKIDVEGYEVPVLRGAKKILKKSSLRVALIETNGSGVRYGFDDERIGSIMMENGFKPYNYDPFKRELSLIKGVNRERGNTLFIRDIQKVQSRVRAAEKILILGHFL
jgi:FkbM family methyltransferase